MSSTVFFAVIGAALMHAGWNVLVKLNLDRFLSLFLIQSLMGVMGLIMLAVFPWPAAASLPSADRSEPNGDSDRSRARPGAPASRAEFPARAR